MDENGDNEVLNLGKTPAPPLKGERRALKHGLNTMKKAVSLLGNRAIDGRFKVSKELAKWRRDLIDDLGGEGNVSVQQQALADLCVKNKLLLDSIDSWLLTQKTLVVAKRKALLPAVLQRQALADGLARYLGQLGLERRHKVKTISDLLHGHDETAGDDNGANGKAAE
jgi:hypothetical protein